MAARFALTAVMYVAAASIAQSQATEPPWEPDEATVKSIEATLTLPSRYPWTPGPLDSYARYYKGMTLNGRRVIYGDLLRGQMAKEKPGIYCATLQASARAGAAIKSNSGTMSMRTTSSKFNATGWDRAK